MTTHTNACETDAARARSAAYTVISYAFQYPDPTLIASLGDPARWSMWPEVVSDMDSEVGAKLNAFRRCIDTLLKCDGGDDSGAAAAELQSEYNHLFGHAVRGKCPSYELEYSRGEIIQQSSGLADIAGFYAAFGVEVSQSADDRADHVSVETEFMSVLCAKEAIALEESHAEHREVSTKAQRSFLKDHLAFWFPAFVDRVGQAGKNGFYGTLASFSAEFLSAECRRFNITPGPRILELKPADPQSDTSISCRTGSEGQGGAGEELIQLSVDSPQNDSA